MGTVSTGVDARAHGVRTLGCIPAVREVPGIKQTPVSHCIPDSGQQMSSFSTPFSHSLLCHWNSVPEFSEHLAAGLSTDVTHTKYSVS